MQMMDNILKDFNMHKFFIALFGMIMIIISLFVKEWPPFIFTNLFGWFLITYAISLKRDSNDIFDLNESRLYRIGFSYSLMILGSLLMRYYNIHKIAKQSNVKIDDNFIILLLGIMFFVISKDILIIVELNLTSFSQYMTIISLSTLIMAKILNTVSITPTQFYLSIFYYIIGFCVSIFNISYNPPDKLANISLIS